MNTREPAITADVLRFDRARYVETRDCLLAAGKPEGHPAVVHWQQRIDTVDRMLGQPPFGGSADGS